MRSRLRLSKSEVQQSYKLLFLGHRNLNKKITQTAVINIVFQLVNQQCVVYHFRQCNLRDTGSYVGYTRGHLHTRIDGHNNSSSSVRKHYDQDHAGAVPEDLLSCFRVLKKCMNKLDCAVNEMLYIKQLRPRLNLQTDSIRARVFV